jgi:DNA repair protein RadC
MRYTVTTFKVRLEVAESGIQMRNSETAEIVARGIFNRLDADKEHFVVMGTNNKNQINGYKEVSTGTLTSSLVTPGEVFLAALRLRAAAIICVHNHPSMKTAGSLSIFSSIIAQKRSAALLCL